MPPLDTGSPHTLRVVDPLNDRAAPAPADFPTVGAYLRAVRERQGRDLADVATATRIRSAYLAAIEAGDYAALPSRPFAIGYVRGYAQALDVDGDTCAELYKAESPDVSEPLRAPVGVKHERRENRPLFFGAAALIVLAVIGWNVVQRAMTLEKAAPTQAAPVVEDVPAAPTGPIALSAPTPPPAEQTTPAPYITPGMAVQTPGQAAAAAAGVAVPAATVPVAPVVVASVPALPVFTPKGTVYGAPVADAGVVLQARKPASLIVRGPGGEVYFARQLAEGESYRAPVGQKLSADVTDPAAFSVYVGGQLRGALPDIQTGLDKYAPEPVAKATTE